MPADPGARSDKRQRRAFQQLLTGVGLAIGGTGVTFDPDNQTLTLDIDGLTELATPADTDFLAVYDVSADANRKVQLSRLTPSGTVTMTLRSTAPTGWLLLNGDTIGNASSGATHASDDLETLFDIIKDVAPNAGTEVFDNGDTVTLPDMAERMPIGLDSTNADIDALGETGGAYDHVHNVDIPNYLGNQPSGFGITVGGAICSTCTTNVATQTHRHFVNPPATDSDAANPPFLTMNFMVKT